MNAYFLRDSVSKLHKICDYMVRCEDRLRLQHLEPMSESKLRDIRRLAEAHAEADGMLRILAQYQRYETRNDVLAYSLEGP